MNKWIIRYLILCNLLWIPTITNIVDANAGWCNWFNCTTECTERLEQAEKDKKWLWDRLVACRKKLPPEPFPQPTAFKTVTVNEILHIFRDAGVDGFKLRYGDTEYKAIPKIEFKSWLKYNEISEEEYIHPGMDCEDFAQHTVVAARQWFPSIAVSEVWAIKKGNTTINHAFIAHIDIDNKLGFYEPQNDGWAEIEDWEVYFVKFDVLEVK